MHRPIAAPRPMLHRPMLLVVLAIVLAACTGTGSGPTGSPTSAATESAAPTESAPASQPDSPSASANPSEGASDGAEVAMSASSFAPGSLTIDVGTTVTFTNNSGVPHTVTNGSDGRPADDAAFDRPAGDGSAVSITFDEPGTYEVTCKIHSSMNMTITVEG